MPQGEWAYSTGDDLDQCPRAVYRKTGNDCWTWMAPLPYVLERLTRRDNARRRIAMSYRLATSPDPATADVVICDDEEVRTGAWAAKLDVALSAAPQIVQAAATAISDTARQHAHAREIAPRVHAGTLELPPTDIGPAGYGETAPGEDHARDAWREIATIAARSPKVALTLGAALGGLYIAPLNRQSFFWFLVGDGGQGKTTALKTASALFGEPGTIAKPWNTTPTGVVQELGNMTLLPAFRDELGASGFRPRDLEKVVFQITQGGNRTTGGKHGIPSTSARWDGVLVSTGNDSIVGQSTNEGTVRRVIEVETPITDNATDAEQLDVLAADGFGWPLRWLQAQGLDVDGFATLITEAEEALPLPAGAVPRSLGRHLALAVAGAARLDTLLGTTGLRDAAMTESRILLDQMIAEIRESGITPGARVLNAVKEAVAARPAAFPTRKRYLKDIDGDFPPAREVEGWLLTDDRAPGDVAVLTNRLEAICQAAGITNSRTGLRQLAKRGVLVSGDEKDGRLRRKLRVRRLEDVYQFWLEDDQRTDDEPADSTAPGTTATPQDSNPGTTEDRSDGDQLPMPDHTVPAAHTRAAEFSPEAASLLTDEQLTTALTECAHDPHAVDAIMARLDERHAATENPAPAAAETTASAATSARDTAPRVHCGVLDTDGLWLPEADTATPVDTPADIAAAYRLALDHHLQQLWIHPRAHAQLGIPETREITAEMGPTTPEPHAWTTTDEVRADPGGLAAWVNVSPASGHGRRVGIVFPAYDWNRTAWHHASTGPVLRDAVLRFAATTGSRYYMSLNETSAAMLRRTDKEEVITSLPKDGTVPHPAGQVHHLSDWSRTLLDEEDTHTWVHSYDLNAAEASVNTSVYVGVGEPEHTTLTTFDRKALRNTAGYVLANVPRQHPKIDPRLPDLTHPWTETDRRGKERGGPAWVPVETLVLLDELGVPIETSEALLWPDSRRLLRPYGERLSKARTALSTEDDEGNEAAGIALSVLKAMYKSRIGDYNRRGSRIFRPDWRDMIKAKAIANGYRSLRKIAAATHRFPLAWHVDAALFTADEPDAHAAAPIGPEKNGKPTGMVFGPGMGQWKPEPTKSLLLAEVREHLGARGFAARLDRVRDRRK